VDNANLVHVVFDRQLQNPMEDSAIFTMHIRGIVDLLPDNIGSVTASDRTAFDTGLMTAWDSIRPYISTKVKLVSTKYYELASSADGLMGPPVQTIAHNVAGTGTGQILPPQLALSVTYKNRSTGGVGRTGSFWGRVYLPGLTTDALDSNGRFKAVVIQTVGDAMRYAAQPAGGVTGCRQTIWSRRTWSHHDPYEVQVDDVPDVIRSRRFSTTTARYKVAI
jgi:hypothetical protein